VADEGVVEDVEGVAGDEHLVGLHKKQNLLLRWTQILHRES